MHWDLSSTDCTMCYAPIGRGILICLFIIFIYILYRILHNRYGYALTKRGLRRIQKSVDAGTPSNRSVLLKEIKFKKYGYYSLVNTILDTFRDMETLKPNDHFLKQWELRHKHLENQVERTFFKRDPFLLFCVLSLFLGMMGFLIGMRTAFMACSMTGSGGLASISGGIGEALMFPFFALTNCTLSMMGFWGAKNSGKWILAEITKLEIRLL